MTPSRMEITPQLLSRLSEALDEITRALAAAHEADVADALNRVDPGLAAEVISALPFEFAVRVLEHPELEQRHDVLRHFPTDNGVAFIRAMSPRRLEVSLGAGYPFRGQHNSQDAARYAVARGRAGERRSTRPGPRA